ncbi:MAG: hypothetical protein KIT84_11920 [Labilithrix sp.]|nr:hypothetical protein [Labilithrix sp.]MCW5811718.1 hypothetical protein [Labilithrix sp.]
MKGRALAVVSLALCAGSACERDAAIESRSVVVYSLRSCPVAESQAFSVVYAAGDFEPTPEEPPIASQWLREVGKTMPLPLGTRAIVVDVSERELGWRGVAEVPSSGPTNVLVWRGSEACRLTRDVERREASGFGVFGRHFLVTGGRALGGDAVPHAFVGDLSTGIIERLAIGPATRRMHPSVTSFRAPSDPPGPERALIAGGSDPDSDFPIASAEVYAPKPGAPSDVGDFEPQRIDLSEPRAEHGAAVLVTGETLLVGGRGPAGPLRTMEVVDPTTRRARTSGVALLAVARVAPTVLRLANGEILVAGGTDATGARVPTLEWFSPDATRAARRPTDLVTGRERGIVPLEAGGALAVVMPEAPAPSDFKTVWVISADGTLEAAAPIAPASISRVRLYPGAEGAPLLWTGQAWMRWHPWRGQFQALVEKIEAPATGPTLEAIANGDTGLALWLEDRDVAGFNVLGFRFAARTRYAALPNTLLADSTSGFAPDRLASLASSPLRFDPARGLTLGAGASAFLTDASFADFDLALEVTASAPVIVLRDELGAELEVGGASCAFAQSALTSLAIARRGPRVDVVVDSAAARACPTDLAPDARISIGLRGPQAPTAGAARALRVTRR